MTLAPSSTPPGSVTTTVVALPSVDDAHKSVPLAGRSVTVVANADPVTRSVTVPALLSKLDTANRTSSPDGDPVVEPAAGTATSGTLLRVAVTDGGTGTAGTGANVGTAPRWEAEAVRDTDSE